MQYVVVPKYTTFIVPFIYVFV